MQLKGMLKDFDENRVLLLAVNPEKYHLITRDIFGIMSKSGGYWIYVTVNKPFVVLKDSFIRDKLDIGGIFFIDMTSKPAGGIKKDANCLYLGDPHDLTSVSIAIDQAVASIKVKNKFILFDTVNTLLNYNNESMVIRFMHSLIGKMRLWGVKGILLSVGMDDRITAQLSQFCDKCIVMN